MIRMMIQLMKLTLCYFSKTYDLSPYVLTWVLTEKNQKKKKEEKIWVQNSESK